MIKLVKITIKKETPKSNVTQYLTQFNVLSDTTVLDFKLIIKSTIVIQYEMVSEKLYDNNKELIDTDLLPNSSYLEYVLLIV